MRTNVHKLPYSVVYIYTMTSIIGLIRCASLQDMNKNMTKYSVTCFTDAACCILLVIAYFNPLSNSPNF